MAQQEQIISFDRDSKDFADQEQPGPARMNINDDLQMTGNQIPYSNMSGASPVPDTLSYPGASKVAVQSSASSNASLGLSPGVRSALNAPHNDSDPRQNESCESPSQQSENEGFQDIFSELVTDSEHEIAFLTRHYAEVLGPWLDLSDSGNYFSIYVPIKAINCPSLKYAIAALAAKQLGRVKGTKSSTARGKASTETYLNSSQVDWFLKAANYYYLAARDLSTSTSDGYTMVSSSAVLLRPVEMVSRWLRTRSAQWTGQGSGDGSILGIAEEMLATVVLLTFYKLMDLNGEDWHDELSGIGSLFESLIQTHHKESFSHGIRASFWNFARQDYLGSYLTRSPTHLDPNHVPLWRAGGISIDEQNKFHIVGGASLNLPPEEQAANGLTWLVSKVINFLAEARQSQIAQWTGSPPSNSPRTRDPSIGRGEQSYPDTNSWLDLCFDFQTWFESVPATFRPCIRIEKPRDLTTPSEGQHAPFPEVYYSSPTCAATMQHYHFGRIALLLNRPPDVVSAPSTAFDRLQGYREVTKEVEYRCREVSGISLGRPQGAVRIHMIPLLFAVGQCVEGMDERRIIIHLLRGVEADLGVLTEYAIQRLQASWSR